MDAKIIKRNEKRLILECLVCGKQFEKFQSTVRQGGGRYCSRQCLNTGKSLFYTGENHWAYGKKLNPEHSKAISASRKGKHFAPIINFGCATCGENVEMLQSEYEYRYKQKGIYPKYCSRVCANKGTAISGKENPNWDRILCVCQFCGKNFYEKPSRIANGRGKFCSLSCLGKSKTGERNPYYGKEGLKGDKSPVWSSIERICKMCDQKFHVQSNRIKDNRGIFCSAECRDKYLRGENHHCWKGGKSFEPYTPEFNEKLKEQIRKRDCYKCQECLRDDIQLHIHHIDYDKANNNPNNLISLCLSCHAKTGFNRGDWVGYFTKKLRVKLYVTSKKCFLTTHKESY